MNDRPSKKQFAARLTALVAICVALCGCGRENTSKPSGPVADKKATLAFWEEVQAPLPRNTLFDRVETFGGENATDEEIQVMATVFRQVAESCREKATHITGLPLVKVDAEAASYGVKKVQVLNATAKFLETTADLTDKQAHLTDGATLLMDYFFALARHADEGEEAWGNALKEQLVGKAQTFGNLQIEGQEVTAFIKALTDSTADLQATEMRARQAMTQRFGIEFPTSQSLKKAGSTAKPAVLSVTDLESSKDALMQNLIGHKVHIPSAGVWTFAELGEFQSFQAIGGTNYTDVVDYEVKTDVKGWRTGNEHKIRLLMTYQKQGDTMKLVIVRCL